MLGLLLLLLCACGAVDPMLARPDDLADYRAFRVAAAEGTRLRRAQVYLARHPNGRFAVEVGAAFEAEEARFFAAAQESRSGVRSYLVDLPEGPHAGAALALLVAFRSDMREAELQDLARRVRSEDARLEVAAGQRRAVSEAILAAVGVLLDEDVYGMPVLEAPPKLCALLLGPSGATWGAVPVRRDHDLFFLLPTRPERQSRLLTLETSVRLVNGAISGATVEGSDLFVRWAEADQMFPLDASAEDRTEAQIHAMTRLQGALERRFPAATCKDLSQGKELWHRACHGWEGIVRAGNGPGDKDAILLQSPRGRTTPLAPSSPR